MTKTKTLNYTTFPSANGNSVNRSGDYRPIIPKKYTAQIEAKQWFAIYTRSRFEKKLFSALQKAGDFEVFLPLVKENRAWSDRIKTVWVPLLPSYVFVKLAQHEIRRLYYFPGFVRIISSEGKPCIIKEEEIALLERIVTQGLPTQKTDACKVGDRVRIIRGPLKGWEGIVDSKKGTSRIVFHFQCIQQAISVEVEMGDLEEI